MLTSVTSGAQPTTGETIAASGEADIPTAHGITPAPADWKPLNPGIAADDVLVQAWPEYDIAQEVLVLVDVTLADSVALPITLTLPVPKGARVTGFAQVAPDGTFDYDRPNPTFDETPAGYDSVTVTAPAYRQLHLEYYYAPPGIPASGARDFPVVFLSPVDTRALAITIQQPKRSTGFSATPAGVTTSAGADGYAYTSSSFTNVNGGDQARIDVAYTKDDSRPSVSAGGD